MELVEAQFEDVGKENWGVLFRVGTGFPGDIYKAGFLGFHLKPIPGSVPWVEVRAQIVFNDRKNERTRVSNGIWHGRNSVKVPFRRGETQSLIVVTYFPNENFNTYEHRMRDPHRPTLKPFLYPLERALEDDILRIQVRLIGEYMEEPVLDQYHWFKLFKNERRIQLITKEEFDEQLLSGSLV